jgi:hypothetical protein
MDREKIIAAAGMFHFLEGLPLVAATERAKQCNEAEIEGILELKVAAQDKLKALSRAVSERLKAEHEKELADEAAKRAS